MSLNYIKTYVVITYWSYFFLECRFGNQPVPEPVKKTETNETLIYMK